MTVRFTAEDDKAMREDARRCRQIARELRRAVNTFDRLHPEMRDAGLDWRKWSAAAIGELEYWGKAPQ